MAELGHGSVSSEVARTAGHATASAASPHHQSLIDKGLIYSPDHRLVAYPVPHFGDFRKRKIPLASS